ncbi:phage tail protein [Larsenimonas rhizosphaerae]|uniref:Phage tail protein n=1 Tax=Larsenimonas rhizosphaerae TaxID=2944682 RepID=A0AA41ZP23_9GAMM|nr:phage tail protein [Larsenimonas rhizosphaerae]MCX2525493.1 phage tail protein [Larsenimonas rhizosphaerae]
MSQFFTLLTTAGQGLLANAIAYGEPLTIAELAIGDGGGTLPSPDASVTRLVNEVRRGPINQTTTDPNNPNWTVIEQVLPPDVGGWTIREVGLYDTDGNLIAYGNYPETYKPQLSEGSARTQTIRFVMEVTDTSAVTLKIDPSVGMASMMAWTAMPVPGQHTRRIRSPS